MAKIGLLIDSLIGGGAERIVLNFYSIFTKLNHEVHIILIKDEIHHSIDHLSKQNLHILSKDGIISKNKFINKLKLANLLKNKVKQIESDGNLFDFFISNSEDMDRISRISRIPNVYIRYRNCMSEYIKNKIGNKGVIKSHIRKFKFTFKFRRIYGNRDIITVSKALADDIVYNVGVKPESIITIYNPFNFNKIREMANEQIQLPKEPYIIYVAKFENRKRHDILIDAYYKSKIPHKLVLLGNCYTKSDEETFQKLKAQIKRLNLDKKVIIPGLPKNPYPWIKKASLFVMSSDNEVLPTVIIESLIIGTTVVSTNCPTGPREILVNELSDFLVPVGNADALAEKIKKALDSYPHIRDEIIQKFDENFVANQYLSHCLKRS
ncbi:glycosyltransferase [Thermodesulfovibrio yellowstonii]|uniref:Glycosyl transferase n=1 Tax=Thermodesulfovibrio yellowstonii TaxID=28262 RepID=A0A9W6GHY2_9BACT|nr:glycosyltransferase [Thermodesulfovibrio islandicus]GLI54206.1 glycosyl transferase [Thermodesulfovibrio islandicus]